MPIKITARSVNNKFKHAWAEYKLFNDKIKEFCINCHIDPELLIVNMSGPHVHIKHHLSPKVWTEEFHNKLCETFDVNLSFFEIRHWSSRNQASAPIVYDWIYGVNDGLDYKELSFHD